MDLLLRGTSDLLDRQFILMIIKIKMKMRAVIFDFIGTTVKAANSHEAVKSISDAFIEQGIFLECQENNNNF